MTSWYSQLLKALPLHKTATLEARFQHKISEARDLQTLPCAII